MQRAIQISTYSHNGLYDLTREVEAIVSESGVQTGLVNVYVKGATAGIMIQFKFMYPPLSDTQNRLISNSNVCRELFDSSFYF